MSKDYEPKVRIGILHGKVPEGIFSYDSRLNSGLLKKINEANRSDIGLVLMDHKTYGLESQVQNSTSSIMLRLFGKSIGLPGVYDVFIKPDGIKALKAEQIHQENSLDSAMYSTIDPQLEKEIVKYVINSLRTSEEGIVLMRKFSDEQLETFNSQSQTFVSNSE